jgi:hypothetical protein
MTEGGVRWIISRGISMRDAAWRAAKVAGFEVREIIGRRFRLRPRLMMPYW